MARLFDDAGSQFLQVSAALATPPFTITCWARSDDNASLQAAVSIANSGLGNQHHSLWMDGSVGGDPVKAVTGNAGTSGVASTSTGYTANTWHHIAGVWAASNSRAAYIDGGSKGTNTTSVTPTTPNTTSIGRRTTSAPDLYFSGALAKVSIWNEALTDEEIAYLAQEKAQPFDVRPWALVAFPPIWGLQSPEIDLVSSTRLWTVTGATPFDHPPMVSLHPFRNNIIPILR
jgi:hypothetical protein